ncbi:MULTISPECIES: enolase C-terminal domain-like protein, partial [Lactobacillus]
LTLGRKIAAEAEAHYKQVSMHSFGGAIHFAASLQMAAAIPNAYPVESEENYNPLRTDLMKEPFKTDEKMNYILSENKPGLGIELDWNKVKKYEI